MLIKSPTLKLVARALSATAQCYTNEHQASKRLLKVAIVGAPNAGKSTLLNRLVDSDISCVSKKVHTTRRNILGVYTEDDTQLEFYDSPGIVTRQHLLKHRLDPSMLNDPQVAAFKCDLIAVLVDASNIREQRRLNKGILKILYDHPDKSSILILNKVDMVKEKRRLLDTTTRLSQGSIDGRCMFKRRELRYMSRDQLLSLNLTGHLEPQQIPAEESVGVPIRRPKHKYVIELDETLSDNSISGQENNKSGFAGEIESPDSIGYKGFSQVFSISALNDEGVDELRSHMLSQAQLVERWLHGPDYVTNQGTQDIVHGIIRGKVLDYVDQAVPYMVRYRYRHCTYDDLGSLHIELLIRCPERYMLKKVLGDKGITIFRIIEDSREMISKTLGCDVKLNIQVVGPQESKRS